MGACGLGLSLCEKPSSEAYNVLTGTGIGYRLVVRGGEATWLVLVVDLSAAQFSRASERATHKTHLRPKMNVRPRGAFFGCTTRLHSAHQRAPALPVARTFSLQRTFPFTAISSPNPNPQPANEMKSQPLGQVY